MPRVYNEEEASRFLATLEPFRFYQRDASVALCGMYGLGDPGFGVSLSAWEDWPWFAGLRCAADRAGIRYTVTSNSVPIAWVLYRAHDGGSRIRVPEVTYPLAATM